MAVAITYYLENETMVNEYIAKGQRELERTAPPAELTESQALFPPRSSDARDRSLSGGRGSSLLSRLILHNKYHPSSALS